MKNCVWILLFSLYFPPLAGAQSAEVQQLLLDVEKLTQLKEMLSDLKKGYEIVYRGYSTIKDISQGNFNLHKVFLDGLLEVSPAVRNYKKVADIISLQRKIVSEYKSAFSRFKQAGKFSPGEIEHLQKVYSSLLDESLKNIEWLTMVITPGTFRMSDDERLKMIDNLYEDMLDKLGFLRHFNNQTSILALQRTRDQDEINTARNFYGISY